MLSQERLFPWAEQTATSLGSPVTRRPPAGAGGSKLRPPRGKELTFYALSFIQAGWSDDEVQQHLLSEFEWSYDLEMLGPDRSERQAKFWGLRSRASALGRDLHLARASTRV